MSSTIKKTQYRVGGLATAGNVGLGTIRHYQKLGLLPIPPKPKNGGARLYTRKDLELLLMIRNAQALGFSLKEIGFILHHSERQDCQAAKSLFTMKERFLHEAIRTHETRLKILKQLRQSCRDECDAGQCQFFSQLADLDLQSLANPLFVEVEN